MRGVCLNALGRGWGGAGETCVKRAEREREREGESERGLRAKAKGRFESVSDFLVPRPLCPGHTLI